MKKYIKPSIEIISFNVKSSVMAMATATPDPFAGTYATQSITSEPLNNDYIPQDIDQKVWSSVDDGDWNWE